MGWLVSILFFVSGLFLLWQGVGFLGTVSWCTRVIIPTFHRNIFCLAAGGICSQFGVLLGVLSLALGVVRIFDKTADKEGFTHRGSYWTILAFMVIFSIVTVL